MSQMKHVYPVVILSLLLILPGCSVMAMENEMNQNNDDPMRARDLGVKPGILQPGQWNAITDVEGVSVGHKSLIEGDDIRTGVTVINPHEGNVFQEKVPGAVYVGNGFGKALGFSQVQELGEIETPIALSNTLSTWDVAAAVRDYMIEKPGMENVRSINPLIGETNDGFLNDIRGAHVTKEHVFEAFENAETGPVEEGNVGAGVGTRAFGFKAGIGTSSRVLPEDRGGYTVGVLVQSNFGGILDINGAPVGEELGVHYMASDVPYQIDEEEGSIMMIVATDAPISSRNLERLAKRSFMSLSRTGSIASNGSGDFVLAFSTHEEVRREQGSRGEYVTRELHNVDMSPLFLGVIEATEEAIYNSLFMAEDMTGRDGNEMNALPMDRVLEILDEYGARQ